jgi:hypothetical protein
LTVLTLFFALAVTALSMIGCAPKQADNNDSPGSAQNESAAAAETQPIKWTMESDCAACHTSEAEGVTNQDCVQAVAHKDQACVSCHTMEAELTTSHASVSIGDKTPTKPSVITVDPQTCITCHGSLEEVAKVTAASTALTDSQGLTVNPHARPAGPAHEQSPATCTDCHNNHSKNLAKDAMKYCAECHHRGVFQCGTCHALRDK